MILVGELRDLETMSIAVTAAEMGILVMGTLHTNGAAPTVDRMVNAFPADKQSHVRTMLSTSLRGVISQQLLQRADGSGRVAALEILINTPGRGQPDPPGQARPARERHAVRRRSSACAPWTCAIQQLLDAGRDQRRRGLQEGHQQGSSSSSRTRRQRTGRTAGIPIAPCYAACVSCAAFSSPRPALRQRPAAPRPHHRGGADRHLGALPAAARQRLPVRAAPRTRTARRS